MIGALLLACFMSTLNHVNSDCGALDYGIRIMIRCDVLGF